MSTKLTTFKFLAAVTLAVAVIFGGYFAVTTVKAQAVTLSELVELFISLGIIPADKAAAARSALATTPTTPTTGGSCTTTFTQNLKAGSTGAEVMALQKFLNSNGFTVSTSGAGSVGLETSYFGPATKAAVIKFQNAHAADVLTPVGLTAGTGYWGASSRAKANTLCSTTGPVTGPVVPGTLSVASVTQPAQSLAPQGASRVPFTKFTLTNSSSAAVTVTGVTVERTGLGVNANFSGVALVDSNNVQYGIAKTLNSNNQAVIGDTFTLNAGETKTFTVAGNMAASLTAYAGQVVGFSVVGINTTATVSGSLPITGASHVINASLTIGSVSTSTSAFDPGAAQTKNIGDTSVRFAGVKFTASSAEDVRLYSIRWRQTGTASASDLSNVMTYVDGTSYPTTVSADGKYFTSLFPSGILIEKGFTKDVYIQGDITGSNVASRTVDFDIDRASDVYFVGQLFGYGIAVSGSYSPWYDSYVTTINAGTATAISKANEVPAQNVAVNVPNQVLGGFATEFKGEGVSVQTITMTYATTSAAVGLVTSATIVNENGAVVAGPVDATWVSGVATFSFADTVTFSTGRHVYTVKGKIPSTAGNNATIAVATTPNSTNWTNATGQISGNTITLPGNVVTMNTMTVKAGAMTVSVSSTPTDQSVVAGVTGFTVANYQFDATQSGEDVRFSSFKIDYDESSLATGDTVNCFAYDGATRLNSSAVNPTTTGTEYTFAFDTNLIVTKGTLKTVAVKCDIPASLTTGTFAFGVAAQPGTSSNSFSGTGVSSGSTIYPTATVSAGSTMTIAGAGTLAVAADSSSPAYTIAAAGTSNVTLGILRFTATNEDIRLNRVALELTAASSSPADLSSVTLWDGATQIGSALFTGTNDYATSTMTSTVIIPANSSKTITVKGNLSAVGTSLPGTQGALIKVNYDATDTTGTQGIGMSSGTAINAPTTSTSDTNFDGVRMFKSYPTFAQLSVPSTVLTTTTGADLTRFSVTANSVGGLGIGKFTINVATSSASAITGTTTVTNLKVYAYTDSGFSSPVSGFTDGQIVTTIATLVAGDNDAVVMSPSELNIPAGTTYYFKVLGDTTKTGGTGTFSGSVTTKVVGDTAYASLATAMMGTLSVIDGQTYDNLIWSPNATTTSDTTHVDWTNGYFVPGLPSAGLNGSTLSI